jgi:hypothetical protein
MSGTGKTERPASDRDASKAHRSLIEKALSASEMLLAFQRNLAAPPLHRV